MGIADPGLVAASRQRTRGGLNRPTWYGAMTAGMAALYLGLVVLGFWFIHRYAVNALYNDQFSDVAVLRHGANGNLTFGTLWGQHNENRVLFPNLIVLALAKTTHFDTVVEAYLSGVIWIAAVTLIVIAHKRRSPSTPWIYYSPLALVLIAAGPLSDALFGAQIGWFLAILGLAGAIFLLDRPNASRWALMGAIAFGVLGSYSAIEGLFIWPAGLLLLYLRRRTVRQMAVWSVSGLVTGVLYFVDYTFASSAGDPDYVLHHPGSALTFFISSFGNVLSTIYPHPGPRSASPVVFQLGLTIVAVTAWAVVRGFHRSERGGAAIGVVLIGFGVIFVLFITLGRSQLGLSAAGRYLIFVLLLWTGTYLVLLDSAPALSQASLDRNMARLRIVAAEPRPAPVGFWRAASFAILVALVLILIAQDGVSTGQSLTNARGWVDQQRLADAVAANIDQADNRVVERTLGQYPVPYLRALTAFARSDRLSFFAGGAAKQYEREGIPQSVLVDFAHPPQRSVLSGTVWLVAGVNLIGPVKSVWFTGSGGPLSRSAIGRAKKVGFGWGLHWDTASVPNGTYVLQATAARVGGANVGSGLVTVEVRNS